MSKFDPLWGTAGPRLTQKCSLSADNPALCLLDLFYAELSIERILAGTEIPARRWGAARRGGEGRGREETCLV